MSIRTRRTLCALASALTLLTGGCRSASKPAPATATPAATAATARGGPTAEEMSPVMVALGDSLFNKGACWRCHAVGGAGTPRGPSLLEGPWIQSSGKFEEIVAIIIRGVPAEAIKDKSRQFPMNPRGGPMNLTDERARAVAAYVWSISRRKA